MANSVLYQNVLIWTLTAKPYTNYKNFTLDLWKRIKMVCQSHVGYYNNKTKINS